MSNKRPISVESMNNQIDLSRDQTAGVLKEVEDNFITSTKGHVTYHRHLMDLAKENDDMRGYMHHSVMMETYEGILRNYEASRRYGSV